MTQPGQDTQHDGGSRLERIVDAERASGANTVPRPETAILQESRHIMHDPVEEAELSTARMNERYR